MALTNDVSKLAPVALAIVSLAILIPVGAVVLTEMEGTSYVDNAVTAEQDKPGVPLPSNYTLDGSTNADYVSVNSGSVTVIYEDSSAGTNTTLTEGTDYEVYYDAGEVEVKNTSTTTDYDDASDSYYTDYTYEGESQATGILGKGQDALDTFSQFFQVVVVVAIAAIIFLLLGALRKTGRRSMA